MLNMQLLGKRRRERPEIIRMYTIRKDIKEGRMMDGMINNRMVLHMNTHGGGPFLHRRGLCVR